MNSALSVHALTGLSPVESNYVAHGPTQQIGHGDHDSAGLFHPDNPLFWFGVVLAASFGLIGVSGSVKLGRAKASAGIGKA
jgi:hypothetical protein